MQISRKYFIIATILAVAFCLACVRFLLPIERLVVLTLLLISLLTILDYGKIQKRVNILFFTALNMLALYAAIELVFNLAPNKYQLIGQIIAWFCIAAVFIIDIVFGLGYLVKKRQKS